MIYQSLDVYRVIKIGLSILIGIISLYTVLYCASYSLLFSMLDMKPIKAFIPLYGQACLFKKFNRSPYLVFLPMFPIVGICYIVERFFLRYRIADSLELNIPLKVVFVLFPLLGNVLVFILKGRLLC